MKTIDDLEREVARLTALVEVRGLSRNQAERDLEEVKEYLSEAKKDLAEARTKERAMGYHFDAIVLRAEVKRMVAECIGYGTLTPSGSYARRFQALLEDQDLGERRRRDSAWRRLRDAVQAYLVTPMASREGAEALRRLEARMKELDE